MLLFRVQFVCDMIIAYETLPLLDVTALSDQDFVLRIQSYLSDLAWFEQQKLVTFCMAVV